MMIIKKTVQEIGCGTIQNQGQRPPQPSTTRGTPSTTGQPLTGLCENTGIPRSRSSHAVIPFCDRI